APTSTINSGLSSLVVQAGGTYTISGTASDQGGGVVGGVEISTDGGLTWHPVTGRTSWTYTWTPTVSGIVTVKTRAVDDSGNLETPGGGVTVTVRPDNTTPPQVSGITVVPVSNGSVTINWLTDEGSTTKVIYGTSSSS